MTRKQNNRNLLIAFALSCASATVFVGAAISDALITELPEIVRGIVFVMTFFAMCGVVVFLGPLGIFPHVKKMLAKNRRAREALWFVPDLEE